MSKPAQRGTELRVHGIGDHGALSALGSGTLQEASEGDDGAALYEAPPTPDHAVQFLSWSRTSRSIVRLLWYVAFPYTLLNVASHMRPGGRAARRFHVVAIALWGALLTVATWLWLLLIAETVLRFFSQGSTSLTAGRWIGGILAVSMVLVLLLRPLRMNSRSESSTFLLRVSVVQTLALTFAAAFLLSSAPAKDTGLRDGRCVLGAMGSECVIFQGDVVTQFAVWSVALATLVGLLFVGADLVARDEDWSGERAHPMAMTGGLLVASTVILHVGWSALRLATDWLMTWVDRNVGAIHREHRYFISDSVLMPWQSGLYGPDMVIGAFTPLLVAAAALLVVYFCRRRFISSGSGSPTAWQRLHSWVCDPSTVRIPTTVACIIIIVVAPAAGWLFLSARLKDTQDDAGQYSLSRLEEILWDVTVSSVHLLMVLVAALLFIAPLRRPLAAMGDIAGFWDIRCHPFCALPYRPVVVGLLRGRIDQGIDPLVLAGHSQGSVLAFESVRGMDAAPKRTLHLVTCGSPLLSLYSRFFPEVFDRAARETVEMRVTSWANFWRRTDPIGCPIFGAQPTTTSTCAADRGPLPDPPRDLSTLRKHSDYWLEQDQRDWVARRLSEAAPEGKQPANA